MKPLNDEQKKRLRGGLSMALFAVLLALLCWYVYQNRADMRKLLTLDGRTVFLLLLLSLCGCLMNCVYHRIILSVYKVKLDAVDWMGVVFVANAIAYVLPLRADLVFTGTYYKRVKGLAYVKSAGLAAGNIVFGVAFALLQCLIALVCTGLIDGAWPAALWLIWALGCVCVAVFLVLALVMRDRPPKALQRFTLLMAVIRGFNDFLRDKNMLARLLACMVVNNVFQLLLYMVSFRAIGLEVTFYQALFYNSVSWMASIMTIVPGNVGVKEGIMGLATRLMGDLFQNGVAVSLLQRVSVMIIYIAAGLLFAYPVWRKWNRGMPEAQIHE